MVAKTQRAFQKAALAASKSKCNYRLGAVVVKQKELARACNVSKTHTLTNKDLSATKLKGMHAEIAACLKASKYQLNGAELFVVRLLKNGTRAMARPCEICVEVLTRFNIKRVHYSISDNEYGVLDL